jgi:hypothetical protein
MDLNQQIMTQFRVRNQGKKILEVQPPIEIPGVRREKMGEMFAGWGFKVGAEIGTHVGIFAKRLCAANPGLKLYCIDPYIVYPEYLEFFEQSEMDAHFEEARERLAPYDVTFIRKTSMEAVKDFEDNSLDFVYIDGNHQLPYVISDLFHWNKKIRPGGILSGHDYGVFSDRWKKYKPNFHVIEAVDCFVHTYKINPWFLLARGHEERFRSYLIVKR